MQDKKARFRCGQLCATPAALDTRTFWYARIKGICNKEAYLELAHESKVYPLPQPPSPQTQERQPCSLEQRHAVYSDIRGLGVREVVEAMDMDQMTNPNVRSAILTMRKEVRKIPGIRYSKYTWNPAYKGVDD